MTPNITSNLSAAVLKPGRHQAVVCLSLTTFPNYQVFQSTLYQITVGRATVATFSGPTVTAQARVRSQVGSRGICLGQIGSGKVLYQSTWLSPPTLQYPFIILHELTNRLTKTAEELFFRSQQFLSWSTNYLRFIEPGRSLPCSQQPTTCIHPEPD
jgi:hypothetical protein